MKIEKVTPVVNAGSLADVAFLLLIFFLVTTTIQTDAGIPTLLPPWTDQATPTPKDNLLVVEINGRDELQIQGQNLPIDAIHDAVRDLVYQRASSPQKAVVQLQNSAQTSYEQYVQVQDAIRAAYHQLWDERAQQQFELTYEQLDQTAQRKIRVQLPLVLAESQSEIPLLQ